MTPSPWTLFTIPSYRLTASIIRSSTGLNRRMPTSRSPRLSISCVESLMSAKRTVRSFLSPPLVLRTAKMSCDDPAVDTAANVARAAPHCPQKRLLGLLALPHLPHVAPRGEPQLSQNSLSSLFGCPQLRQSMTNPSV